MLTTDQQKLIIFLVAWCGFTDQEAMEFIKLFRGEKIMRNYIEENDLIDQYGAWYPREDWVYEVVNGDTNSGYWGWVANKLMNED